MSSIQAISELRKLSTPDKAKIYQRFFKTGEGEYGQGDLFLGLTVPETRKIAKKYSSISLKEIEKVLKSKYHEERLFALFVLVNKFNSNPSERKKIFDFYLEQISCINNWDLVDTSADKIVGRYLFDHMDYENYHIILMELSKSSCVWERRIAIISTFYFIKNNKFNEALEISQSLLTDKHDLIHKATGWMLREIGKRNLQVEEKFLMKHYKSMPRTMLRYAIERFPEEKRKKYLLGMI